MTHVFHFANNTNTTGQKYKLFISLVIKKLFLKLIISIALSLFQIFLPENSF